VPTTKAPTGCIAGDAKMHILFKAAAPARRLLQDDVVAPRSLFDQGTSTAHEAPPHTGQDEPECRIRDNQCPAQREKCEELPPGCQFDDRLQLLDNGLCCPKICEVICPRSAGPAPQVTGNVAKITIASAANSSVPAQQVVQSKTIATAVAGKLGLAADELSMMTYKEEGTDSTFHTELQFKGDDSIEKGYALEQDVVQNKFNPIPGYPINRLYMEQIFDCGTHAVGAATVPRTDFNMPNTGFRGLTPAPKA